MASEKLVSAWEEAYQQYTDAAKANVADTSVAVASAWRALAENTELPWWLFAAVNSAAEAFEQQGDTGGTRPVNGAVVAPRRADGDDDQESERTVVTPVGRVLQHRAAVS
jgi:hypothetical protein